MSSLSERLEALGVKIGASNIPDKKKSNATAYPISQVLPGDFWNTPHGDIFFVETCYKTNIKVGSTRLKPTILLDIIAEWAKEPHLSQLDPEQFVFVDTETTGLAGGTGTYTFLIGAGRFEGDQFRLVQFFLSDPSDELAQLAALEAFLAPCKAVISFNGKSFDIPLINTRYIINGWPSPLAEMAHVDLLHLARRLWRDRLSSRTLGNLEAKILRTKRSEADVPGWMIPDLYFDYLHTGDARPLRGIFYHNEVDVISLAALLTHINWIVSDPLNNPIDHGLDLISIGKLYACLGYHNEAVKIYQTGMAYEDVPENVYWKTLCDLSFIYKKQGNLKSATDLWMQAANQGQIYAHEELAKFCEHVEKDFQNAYNWTVKAIRILNLETAPAHNRVRWLDSLNHRKNRLERKLASEH